MFDGSRFSNVTVLAFLGHTIKLLLAGQNKLFEVVTLHFSLLSNVL